MVERRMAMTERFSLKNKVAIVTGASRGIGKEIAMAFAESGANVAITGRSVQDLEKTADQIQTNFGTEVLLLPMDVTDTEQMKTLGEKTIKKFGRVDILVNNAGIVLDSPFQEITEEKWQHIFNVNVHGIFRGSQSVVNQMIEQKYGKIINISSIHSIIGVNNFTAYCSTKGAVTQITKSLAAELARHNIQVNAICPGYVKSEITKSVLDNEDIYEKVIKRIPLKRMAEPEEIAWLAVYLASDIASFITGESIVMDGGQTVI
jgi:NAD(P)-dependent dehydrogenase (short-subunit alcohol dehydrogenase family)